MADSNQPVAPGRYRSTGRTSALPGQKSPLGSWAAPAKLSRRLGVFAGTVNSVAPPARRARSRGALAALPTTTPVRSYRMFGEDKPYLAGGREAARRPDGSGSVGESDRPNTATPPHARVSTRLRLRRDDPASSRPMPQAPANDALPRRGAGGPPIDVAAPQWPLRTVPIGLLRRESRRPDIQITPTGLTRTPGRSPPVIRPRAVAPMVPAADGEKNESTSFAPPARAREISQVRAISTDASSMGRSNWPRSVGNYSGSTAASQTPQQGTIHLDGNALGQWMSRHLERILLQPERGPTAVDTRVIPDWRAANVGY